jgi:hypothetical protein
MMTASGNAAAFCADGLTFFHQCRHPSGNAFQAVNILQTDPSQYIIPELTPHRPVTLEA